MVLTLDLNRGTSSNQTPTLAELKEPPIIKGKLPKHTVLMWDLDAPSCNINQKWLHMIYTDDSLFYRSPCPPDRTHRYVVKQFPDEAVDFNWKWGCIDVPSDSLRVKETVTISVETALDQSECGPLVAKGRGVRTRGWRLDAPKRGRGRERERLYKNCKEECFLKPEKRGFPICKKCQSSEKCQCQIDCRGIAAAKVRAHQWKYRQLYQKIDMLEKQHCGTD